MSVVLLLNQSWYNKELAWDEEDFPFTTMIIPWGSVWTPTLTVEEAYEVTWSNESPDVILHKDGKVELQLTLRIDSNCNFDLIHYPIDSSDCTLSFFSLASKESELEFKVSVKNKILNVKREYLITGVNIRSPKNMEQPYFVVKITIQNTGVRIILSLIVPSTALIVSDLCGFLIPLKERLSYMVTLLLAYLVFYSSLVGSLPGSSSCSPLLSYYYTCLLMLLFFRTIQTIVVAKLVSDNFNLWQNCGFRGENATITTRLPKDQSCHPEDSDGSDTNEGSSHLKPASAALDKLFFFIYLGLVVTFHVLFLAVWALWQCKSEKPPGGDHLDGIQW
nr:zinc-activated ligand-gated ion channel [Pogona vitticeps]